MRRSVEPVERRREPPLPSSPTLRARRCRCSASCSARSIGTVGSTPSASTATGLDFFLEGVATIADEAVASARDLFALVAADRARVLAHVGMSVIALRLLELLPRHPVVTVASVMKLVDTTKPTAGRAIELLVAAGVLVETTGKKRERSFVDRSYLDRLRVGTELGRAEVPGR